MEEIKNTEDYCQEILEYIWMCMEDGKNTKDKILQCNDPLITEKDLSGMIQSGYLIENNGKIEFSESGNEKAKILIRSHRLSERLFTDILNLGDKFLEQNACKFEHILSQEVTEAICTLLGHPKECPHGRHIPPGDCCKNAQKELESIICSLSDLKSKEAGGIVYISSKHHVRLNNLMALGVSPGVTVKVHQTFPSYVIRVGETDIAIDDDILKDIYVRKLKI